MADYADDKALMSIINSHITSNNLQTDLLNGDFKVNRNKCIHTFPLILYPCPNISLYNISAPSSPTVKYLGLTHINA